MQAGLEDWMDGLSRNPRYLNDEWFSRKLVWRVNRYQQSENIGNKSYCEKKLGTRASCYLDGNFSRKNKVQISCVWPTFVLWPTFVQPEKCTFFSRFFSCLSFRAVLLNQHFCVSFFFDHKSGLPCGVFVERIWDLSRSSKYFFNHLSGSTN